MKKRLPVLITLYLILIVSINTQATEQAPVQSLVVITDNRHPLQNVDLVQSTPGSSMTLTVFNLDDVNTFEMSISQGLPLVEQDATRELLHRINTMGRDNFNTELMNAYSGVFYVLKNRIDRYPAIVFDDSVIVFGVTDLQEALRLYQQWIAGQKVNNHD